MHEPFLQLPAPILLIIIKLVPDFPSLDHFIRASPIANGIFEEIPVEIMEDLINRLPRDVAEVIQAFSVSLSNPRIDNGAPESGRTHMPKQVYQHSLAEPAQYPLPLNITLSSVKELLRRACRIHHPTTLFSEIYINRVNAIRPLHLVNPSHNFGEDPFVDYPEGRSYIPPRTGPASWVEELRVARALWLLHYDNLTSHAPYQFQQQFYYFTSSCATDEMECVFEFLVDNQISLDLPDHNQQTNPASSQFSSSIITSPPLHSFALASPPTDLSSHTWRHNAEAAKGSSPAKRFFGAYAPISPLKNIFWRPFRRLGFDIWDLKRMCTLELMNVPGELLTPGGPYEGRAGIRMSPGHIGLTWRSIEERENTTYFTYNYSPSGSESTGILWDRLRERDSHIGCLH